MTSAENRTRSLGLVAGVLAGLIAGAAGAFWVLGGFRHQPAASPTPAATVPAGAGPSTSAPTTVIAVTLTPEVLARAGIDVAAVRSGAVVGDLRIPAIVTADAYRQVVVTAASSGRVTSVAAEAGQVVRRGEVLVRLHSPAVAETERALRTAHADRIVWDRQVARLDRLVGIGAASQQEHEAARAQAARLAAEVESLRTALVQFGRTPDEIAGTLADRAPSADVEIRSPVAGTVTERSVNPGQNAGEGAPLVTVIDLSSVWVVGDVYERDLARLRVGNPARIMSAAFPGDAIGGRVSYVDPLVTGETRTGKVRVELPNPGGRLRPGMFVEMRLDDAAGSVLLISRDAIQTIDRTDVVYVVDPAQPGRFVERSVRLGTATAGEVVVLAGLAAGEQVVTRGSFLVRSERDRQHPGAPAPAPVPAASAASQPVVVDISVSTSAFSPEQIPVPAGRAVRLVFTRRDEASCATEVVIPALGIKKALPLNQAVTIDLPPQPAGTLAFQCGMDMLRGALVVR